MNLSWCCCHVLLLSWGLDLVRAQTCPADDTPSDALGPFYIRNATLTTRLAREDQLSKLNNVLHVEGRVYGNDCTPMDSILVEAWYAGDPNENGGNAYSVAGSDLLYRGNLFTDKCGYYSLKQTYPIVYAARPIRHVHFRFMNGLLATQMYFEGDIPAGYNPDASQVVKVTTQADGSRRAVFDVYLDTPGTSNLQSCTNSSTSTLPPTAPPTTPSSGSLLKKLVPANGLGMLSMVSLFA
jgi:protocatechuate 3,4-dioxygenase beta subunit